MATGSSTTALTDPSENTINGSSHTEGVHQPGPVKSVMPGKEVGINAATNRLRKELMDLMLSCDKGVSAFPDSDNIFRWVATIDGPQDTVYQGLKFKLRLEFSSKYPYCPPRVNFTSTCFHPNVDSEGNICLDILKDKWTASYDVRTMLLSIQSLLNEPNLESPLDPLAASLWNKPEFKDVLLTKYNNEGAKSKKVKY